MGQMPRSIERISSIDENGHCACAVSRDLYVGARKDQKFGNFDPDLPIHYTTFRGYDDD